MGVTSSHGKPRVDDRRVSGGIVSVVRNGLRWKDAPHGYGPLKTFYNRFARWSRMGLFAEVFVEPARAGQACEVIMIGSTHTQALRTAASPAKGGASAPYRTLEGRPDLEGSCRLRRARAASATLAQHRPDQRLHRCAGAAGPIARCADDAC